MHKRGITAAMVTGLTVLATAAATGTASAAPSPQSVPNTKPAWTAHAKSLGHASSSSAVSARVYLAPRGGLAAVRALATAVSTPGSAQYQQFLTTDQYNARFAPDAASVRSVSDYLKSAGLTVTGVGAGNRYVSITGTVKSAEKAFNARINKFNHNGRTVQAPTSNVVVPASVASAVLTVSGLDTTPQVNKPASKQTTVPQPALFRNARPCSVFYGQVQATYQADFKTPLPKFQGKQLAYAPCGYTGPQFRAAYEGNTTLDGTGVTVAIVDAYNSPTIRSDTNTYAQAHGDGAYAPGQYTQVLPATFTNEGPPSSTNPNGCDASGWYGEQTLDVEAVHAMAPGANIRYYGSKSCLDSDFIDTLTRVVDQNKVSLVSNSWGGTEAGETADQVAAYESVFLQGATEGISFMFSSGDNGDELASTGVKQADYPTSDPYVTSVGGTATGIVPDATTGAAIGFQTGWGTQKYSLAANGKSWSPVGYLYGAGGGSSSLFNRPSYQDGVTDASSRQVPDVAMDADPNTGMLIGISQTFPSGKVAYSEYRIGGTSLASPLFAGITALTLQHSGKAVGLLNPAIYKNKAAFTDVLPRTAKQPAGDVRVDYKNGVDPTGGLVYSVRTFDQDSSLLTTKGYDQTTGIGVPSTTWLTALG